MDNDPSANAGRLKHAMPIRFKLQEAVEKSGVSIRRLAQNSHVDYKTLHRLKTGRQQGVSFPVLDRICHALKCEPGALFEIVDEEKHFDNGPRSIKPEIDG